MPRQPKTEKAKQTLKQMKQHRLEDSIALRENIKVKLEWAKTEKKKGLETIDRQLQQIRDNKDTILKLDGIILVLTELLEPVKETKNPDENDKIEK